MSPVFPLQGRRRPRAPEGAAGALYRGEPLFPRAPFLLLERGKVPVTPLGEVPPPALPVPVWHPSRVRWVATASIRSGCGHRFREGQVTQARPAR